MKQNNLLTGCLCAIGCETLFGMSYIFTKQAIDTASTLSLLGWRFLLAFCIMSLCIALGLLKINLKGKSLKPLLLIVICSPVIYFIGETIGIQKTTASESGVFLACIPVAALIASSTILHKKPMPLQITGILITLAGVLITVFAVNASSSFSLTGYTFLLLAVVSCALYCVFVEKAAEYTGIEITYAMLTAGALVFVFLAVIEAVFIDKNFSELITLPFQNKTFLIAVLYQGIGCSILAFFLSNIAIAKIGVNRTSSFLGIGTVVSILTGAFILHEPFTTCQILGAVIILIGVYIANIRKDNYK